MDALQFQEITSRTFDEVLAESVAILDQWVKDRRQHPLTSGRQH